ncbi:MAG TPA: thioredoxin [Pyrinomonadaceae bacterium]|nr:thioredoxin [Pyrinomonadaceae bacterium]
MSKHISAVTDASFEAEVLKSDRPVVVDFWATWCPPCRALNPVVEELAEKYAGAVRFVKLDIDENSAVPQRYGIKGIPTLIVFERGREAERVVGLSGKDALSRVIDKYAAAAV